MARKLSIEKVIANLDRAQNELAKKWADAILKSDIDTGENLRNHMLALIGYRKDIERILEQVDEYIAKNKLLETISSKEKKSKKGKSGSGTKSSRKYFRTKPLPPVGTKLYGSYKGKKFVATVTSKGIKVNGINKIFSSMSAATAAVTGKRTISGWAFWKFQKA